MRIKLNTVPRTLAFIVGSIGALVLTGWIFDIPLLKSILPDLVTMKCNTAICLLFSGIALWSFNKNSRSYLPKAVVSFCSFIILLTSLVTLGEYVFDINAGIDELFFKDNDLLSRGSSNPGRMSPNTAVNFVLNGFSLLFLSKKFRVTQVLTFLSLAVAFFAVIGYIYSVNYLTNFSSYNNKMALHTAIGFLLLGIGILFSQPGKGIMSVILSRRSGGVITRPLLLFALIVPVLSGWLLLKGQSSGLFQSIQFGVALVIITMTIIFIVIIWWNARSLNLTDIEKEKVKISLANLNIELEAKVVKRTRYLDTANKALAFQNEEKEKRSVELTIANTELAFQNEEKEKRAAELIVANKELTFQNEEKEKRAAELIVANKELTFQNEEKEKRAAELIIANSELAFQNQEKEKRAAELIVANMELAFQNEEKEKRAAELIIANDELAFQNKEKENRAAELFVANGELAFQNGEKEKRAAELIVANQELAFQNREKEKRAAELVIANKELAFQNEEKEKRAAELFIANSELKKTAENLTGYILGLEEMMFMTSHKVRHPVATILGLSNLLDNSIKSPAELKQLVDYIKQSALSLDGFTRELTTFMKELERKGKIKNSA